MPGLDDAPEQTSSGRLITVARIKIHPGKEAHFEELISTCRVEANSDKEPGTFTYRTTRVLDKSGKPTGEYIVFEEYAGKSGLVTHAQRPSTSTMLSSTDILSIELEYGEEF